MKKTPGKAFTLIEVTLGLAILILIFGVIFQLVQVSLEGADLATKYSRRHREVGGLFALVRQICMEAPPASQFGLEKGQLVITNAPAAIFREVPDSVRTLEFISEREPGGGRRLKLVEQLNLLGPSGEITPGGGQTNTFELMRDIAKLEWSVWNPQSGQEETLWQGPAKPSYLKMNLVRREGGRNVTNTGIFWIPSGGTPGNPVPQDPVCRTGWTAGPSTNTNSTPGGVPPTAGTNINVQVGSP
ncbi:hypothetical protein EBT23_01005 [bacterium]|nr:hypothetical protein [bacterium]